MRDPLVFENLMVNAGWSARTIVGFFALLVVLGLFALIRGVPVSSRWACSIACLFPAVIGMLGTTTSTMRAFSIIGPAGMRNPAMLFSVIMEVGAALMLGLAATAILLALATLVWLRGARDGAHRPPPLPGTN